MVCCPSTIELVTVLIDFLGGWCCRHRHDLGCGLFVFEFARVYRRKSKIGSVRRAPKGVVHTMYWAELHAKPIERRGLSIFGWHSCTDFGVGGGVLMPAVGAACFWKRWIFRRPSVASLFWRSRLERVFFLI